MKPKLSPPGIPVASHPQAQSKVPSLQRKNLATHVQAAISSVQAKPASPQLSRRNEARHVLAAIQKTVQPKLAASVTAPPQATHVQAAIQSGMAGSGAITTRTRALQGSTLQSKPSGSRVSGVHTHVASVSPPPIQTSYQRPVPQQAPNVVQRYDPEAVKPFLLDSEGNVREDMGGWKAEMEAMQTPKKGKKPGNFVGKYAYHTTSYQNLPGIIVLGLDPDRGGGSGGSCSLCEDSELQATSIENSKGKIAVATDRMTAATYIHQREKWADENSGGYIGSYAMVLRFKIKLEHTQWSVDPDDKRAWHLTGTKIPPQEIECLTTDGWVQLVSIKSSIYELLFGFDSVEALLGELNKVRRQLTKSPSNIALRLRQAELLSAYMDMTGISR